MNSRVETLLQKGKYRIDRVLGRGEFGITYRAVQTLTNQFVAIKTLNPNLRHHADFAQFQHHFKAVAQRLSVCQHPNLVRVLDGFEEKGLPFIVMDYIPGEPVVNQIHSGTALPITEAIRYIRQVASALKVVHQQGLIHCNLNLETILLKTGTDQVILTDFGIASRFTDAIAQPYLGSRSLSGGYAALEQYLPHEKLTPATDIYSLAALFHCLLTTQPPLEAPLCLSQANQTLLNQSKPSLRQLQPHLSPALEKVIMWGLELEQQHRPQTVEQWLAFIPEIDNAQPASPEVPAEDLNLENIPLVETSEQPNLTATSSVSSPTQVNQSRPAVVGLVPIFLVTALFSGWTGFNLTRLYGGILTQKSVLWNQESADSEFPRNYDPSKPMFEDPSIESKPLEVVEDSDRDFDYWEDEDDELANREIEGEENSQDQDQWSQDDYSSNQYDESQPYDLREPQPYSSESYEDYQGYEGYNRYDSASELNSTYDSYSGESYSEPRDRYSEYPVNSTNSYSSDYQQPQSDYGYSASEAPLESEEYNSPTYPSEVTPSYSSPYQNSTNYPASDYSAPSPSYRSDSWESESQSEFTPEPSLPSEDTWSPSTVPSSSYSDPYPEVESEVNLKYSLPSGSNSVPKFDTYPQTPLSDSDSQYIPADAT